MSQQAGFTMIEVLLSMLMLSIIAFSAFSFTGQWQPRADLNATVNTLGQLIRLAQSRSEGMNGDQSWGVRFLTGSAVIFKGATYATRDTTADETTMLPSTLTLGGTSEVVFAKLEADPTPTSSSITVTSSAINEVRTITINAHGLVAF